MLHRFKPKATLEGTLQLAQTYNEGMGVETGPFVAVVCYSDYGSAWFTKHDGGEWRVHDSTGESLPADTYMWTRREMVDKMLGSGVWIVVSPAVHESVLDLLPEWAVTYE